MQSIAADLSRNKVSRLYAAVPGSSRPAGIYLLIVNRVLESGCDSRAVLQSNTAGNAQGAVRWSRLFGQFSAILKWKALFSVWPPVVLAGG
jgi:hypothetical protein